MFPRHARSVRGRGTAATGLVLAVTLSVRLLWSRRLRTSIVADEPVAVTEDGVSLHVEVDGDPAAPLTVVLVHGFAARLDQYDGQRQALRSQARLVLYDQRGHGRSGWGRVRRATLDQLGRDLGTVIDEWAPTGPLVLIGHSLGGMTIMALAATRPELVRTRVVGAGLLATSAGHLAAGRVGRATSRLLVASGALRVHLALLWLVAPLLDRLELLRTRAGRAAVRRYLFAAEPVDPALAGRVRRMLSDTRWGIAAAFLPSLLRHHRADALAALRDRPTVVVHGTCDQLIPVRHGRRIAELLGPGNETVIVPGAGHMVPLTHPGPVDAALHRLLARCRDRAVTRRRTAPTGSRGRGQVRQGRPGRY